MTVDEHLTSFLADDFFDEEDGPMILKPEIESWLKSVVPNTWRLEEQTIELSNDERHKEKTITIMFQGGLDSLKKTSDGKVKNVIFRCIVRKYFIHFSDPNAAMLFKLTWIG
jgi:hypothetical protein